MQQCPRIVDILGRQSWALLALVGSVRVRAAIAVFKDVYIRDSGFFNGRVLRTFLSTPLRHRQSLGDAEIANLFPALASETIRALGPSAPGLNPPSGSPTVRVLITGMTYRRGRTYAIGPETFRDRSFASLGHAAGTHSC